MPTMRSVTIHPSVRLWFDYLKLYSEIGLEGQMYGLPNSWNPRGGFFFCHFIE